MGVMNVGRITKAFGSTTEKTSSVNANEQNLTSEQLKELGGDNIGDVLNKLTDSNYVDPAKKMRTTGSDKLDKDAFFKLMIAQMKNQDPTNPLKPHETSAQLAQFSSLEQLQNVNSALNEMRNAQKPTEQFQMLNLLGKSVEGDSAKLVRAKGDKEHDFKFMLPEAAVSGNLSVTNEEGEVIRKIDLKDLKKGDNVYVWNGKDDRGNPVSAGSYTFALEVKNSANKKMNVSTSFEGLITGLNYTPEGPVLLIGTQTVRLRDIKKIVDPSLMKNDQNLNKNSVQDLKNESTLKQTNKESKTDDTGAPEKKAASSILDNVALSKEMMNKVSKAQQDKG